MAKIIGIPLIITFNSNDNESRKKFLLNDLLCSGLKVAS